MRFAVVFFAICACLPAETRSMTLRQAVETAMTQNADLVLSRLDEQRAALNVRVARDPFVPKVTVGSGLAYTNGFPLSIEGSAPSIFQAQAISTIYNKPLSYQVAQAKENARGAALDTQAKRDDVALRIANLYLDSQRAKRQVDLARRQVDSLQRVLDTVQTRVSEGRELPLEGKRAMVNLARARQRLQVIEGDLDYAGRALASALGLPPEDQILPTDEETPAPQLPGNEEQFVDEAMQNSRELRRLQSALVAKGFEIKSYRSARLPTIDLVAQYAMLGRFNNYEEFYRGFQRNNGQIGMSFTLPILPGAAASAQAQQAELDSLRLKTQINQTRNRIALDARRAFQELRESEAGRDVAQMDLELAREQLSVLLARLQEGRATARDIEEARFVENERWIAFYDAMRVLDQARLNLLRQRGDLLAALR